MLRRRCSTCAAARSHCPTHARHHQAVQPSCTFAITKPHARHRSTAHGPSAHAVPARGARVVQGCLHGPQHVWHRHVCCVSRAVVPGALEDACTRGERRKMPAGRLAAGAAVQSQPNVPCGPPPRPRPRTRLHENRHPRASRRVGAPHVSRRVVANCQGGREVRPRHAKRWCAHAATPPARARSGSARLAAPLTSHLHRCR
jgi:hypothetical protein